MEFLFRTELWYTLGVVLLAICVGLLWRSVFPSRSSRKQLPGPWGLPIVGYIPFLGRKMNKTITALAKRYGDVFQLPIGTRKVVVISGQRAIREALLNKATEFAGRPNFYSYTLLPNFGLSDYSPAYRAHKQLSQRSFQAFTRERRAELMQVFSNPLTRSCCMLKNVCLCACVVYLRVCVCVCVWGGGGGEGEGGGARCNF